MGFEDIAELTGFEEMAELTGFEETEELTGFEDIADGGMAARGGITALA